MMGQVLQQRSHVCLVNKLLYIESQSSFRGVILEHPPYKLNPLIRVLARVINKLWVKEIKKARTCEFGTFSGGNDPLCIRYMSWHEYVFQLDVLVDKCP